MIELAELAQLFDRTLLRSAFREDNSHAQSNRERMESLRRDGPWPWRATEASRALIEERIGAALPDALVEFAELSVAFPNWFAALGEDTTNPLHLLRCHSRTRTARRRKQGKWRYIKPASLIPITVGFDGDYDCLDLARPSCVPGEFEICYWSTPATEGSAYQLDFRSYLLSHLLFWTKGPHRGDAFSAGLHRRATELQAQQAVVLDRLYLGS